MKKHLQTFAAALVVCGFAVAQYPTRARFAAPGTSTADIVAALVDQTVVSTSFRATAASAAAAFMMETGAKLCLTAGATCTDHLSCDGTTCTLSGTSLALNTGSVTIATNSTMYLNGTSFTAGTFFDGTDVRTFSPNTVYVSGDGTSPAKAAFRIGPQDAEPTGANVVGDMYVTTAGVLKICTVAGTPGTWVSVGAQ